MPQFPSPRLLQMLVGINWLSVIYDLMHLHQPVFNFPQAIVAVYRCLRFLQLVVEYPDAQLVPTKEIDAVIHLLETTPLFKRYFDHQPGLGTRGEADRQTWLQAFQTTRERFEQRYGTGAMGQTQPASCQIVDYRYQRTWLNAQPAACEICLKAVV